MKISKAALAAALVVGAVGRLAPRRVRAGAQVLDSLQQRTQRPQPQQRSRRRRAAADAAGPPARL